MKVLNDDEIILKLKNLRDARILADTALPYPTNQNNVKQLINKWNSTAYHQISKIVNQANHQTKNVIINTFKSFNNKRHSNGFFYSHVGYKGFGMVSLFNRCIRNIKKVNSNQKKVSSRINA